MSSGRTTLVSTRLTALSRALADLAVTLDAGGLDALDDRQLVEFLQGLEAVRDATSVVAHRALQEATSRGMPEAPWHGRSSGC
jgi:hypothetical protein